MLTADKDLFAFIYLKNNIFFSVSNGTYNTG